MNTTRREAWGWYMNESSRLTRIIRDCESRREYSEARTFSAARVRLVDRMTDVLSRRCWTNDLGQLVSPLQNVTG